MSAVSEHIEMLRHRTPTGVLSPTLEQVRAVSDDVFNLVPLHETMERDLLAGYTASEVALIAEGFGKFRARSHKGSLKAETLLIEEAGFIVPPPREQLLLMAQKVREKLANPNARITGAAAVWLRGVDPRFLSDVPPVIIPSGYEPKLLGRNIRASLGALVKDYPDDAEVERYWTRNFGETDRELTAEHVHLLWWFASHGLGYKLAEIPAKNTHLCELMVRAHDLLEDARLDASAAVEALTAPAAHEGSVTGLRDAVAACSWVDQGLFARVSSVLDVLESSDTPRLRSMLGGRLGTIARWKEGGVAALADVGYLNEAHIHLLTDRAGLAHNEVEERKVRAELRAKLTALGLGADLDQELPAGISAWRQGRLEEFYASRTARAEGDLDWALLYQTEESETVTV